MKKLLASVALATAVFAAPALAETPGAYGKISVGSTFESSANSRSLSNGPSYGAYLGEHVGPFRLEIGGEHISGDIGSLRGNAYDLNATAYADLKISDRATVYAGAGVDYVLASVDTPWFSDDGNGYGWHLTAGAAYAVNDQVTVEAQVRRLETDLAFDSIKDQSLESYDATVGVRLAL